MKKKHPDAKKPPLWLTQNHRRGFFIKSYFQIALKIKSSTIPTPTMTRDTAVLHFT